MRIIFILLLFIFQKLTRADDEQDEWRYPENCIGYACDYRAQWWYLEKTDEIKFVISTKFRNKWTGIGFSDGQQMKGTDAVIGLVEDNGRYFLMDTFLSGYQAPPLDAVQNIQNMTVFRENGITHLQFHRFRTTNDLEYDFQFTDDHCAYFHFVIRGGVFNAVNKRMRKHEETPIVSKERICIRSKDPKKHKKIDAPPPIRFSMPNKPKLPTRFKVRPKLTNLISTTTTNTTTSSSIQPFKSPESTTKPIDQSPTTLSVDLTNNSSIDKSNDQITSSTKPTSTDNISVTRSSTSQSTMGSESSSISSLNVNENLNSQNSKETTILNAIETNKSSEPKNEDKLEYGDEDEETTSPTNENLNKKTIISNNLSTGDKSKNTIKQDGRISTDNDILTTKNTIKSYNFDLKILNSNSSIQLNSTMVLQETEKELSDLTGFRQIKLTTFKPITINDSKKKDTIKPISWIVDFEIQVQTETDTNETDYLSYLQNALNETVASGHVGNLMLDTSHYALLKQDFNQTKEPEAKYVFEYNFFNQLTVKLTKEQLKLAYIIVGVSLLVLLVLMQACCMCCCTSSESNKDLHKQNNLSNSSTLQDKHHLNMHHHAQYNDHYIKNCANNYSYENFALDASDIGADAGYDMASYKKKHKHSLSKHDPMIYNNYHQNYSNSYNRRPPDFGYNYNNGNFNHPNNHHSNNHHSNNHHSNNHHSNNHHHGYHHGSSSHLRYFEPQPMHSLEPDFYFMPKQRVKHCYNN